VSAVAPPRPQQVPQAAPPTAAARTLPWAAGVCSGVVVLLASAPVSATIQGYTWLGHAVTAAIVVVLLGIALHRAGPFVVVAGQCVGVLLLVTAEFADGAVLGVFPGPTAFGSFRTLVAGAGAQIAVGIAPVAATPEILFLVTAAFGMVTVAVYLAAVLTRAPAAAGVPLLAVFAVPAALDDALLPWQTVVCAAAGFGILLITPACARRQRAGGIALVAGAVAIALGIGAVSGFVGTTGRFAAGAGGGGGAIGLSPFTSLRGQLTQSSPAELFRVRGLPQAAYLRALTLSTYVPDVGWQATRPGSGPTLPGTLGVVGGPGVQIATVDVENVGFKDYWLPMYGQPIAVTGLEGRWTYDERSGTAYTGRPRAEAGWQQTAGLSSPSADQLRKATGSTGPVVSYLDTAGVDGRVIALARQLTAGAGTAFDKAIALQDYFTGPTSTFHYSLQTAPGNGDDALVDFLTVGKTGYCEQFSAAMAVMLRSVGVPARVAVGFTGGSVESDHRTVSTSDAHAWVEAWFPGYGWLIFDPTPLTDGRTIVPPYVAQAEAQEAAAASAAPSADPGSDARQASAPQDVPTPEPVATDMPAPAADGSALPLWQLALGACALLVACGALLPAALRARDRRRRLAAAAAGGPEAAAAAWAELLAESIDRGVPTKESDTVRVTARRLVREHSLDGPAQHDLRKLVGGVEASWYGKTHPGPGDLEGPIAGVLAAVAAGSPLSRRGRLLPRSVLHGRHRPRGRGYDNDAAPTKRGGGAVQISGAIPARTGGGNAPPSGR
jgi:transglutaminase-like putative cysteine protease